LGKERRDVVKRNFDKWKYNTQKGGTRGEEEPNRKGGRKHRNLSSAG